MTEIPNTLFSETQIKELSANTHTLPKQKKAIQRWKNDLDAGKLDIESQYKDYLRDLMIEGLDYPREKIIAETGEMNTRLDYSYIPDSGKNGVLFELKSRNKKLFEYQGYDKLEQKTPVDQAIDYIAKNTHISYAIVTNFEEFVLITREDLKSACYKFRFPPKGMKLLDSEINTFFHFFSKKGIESGHVEEGKHETIIEEENITDDFYKLYHQTRLMLIHSFNDKIEYQNAIRITQQYLNRLIFLFFAEDNGLIKRRVFTEGILAQLNAGNIKEKTTDVSNYIQTLFTWMNEGSHEIDHKLGFNGEFFKESIDRNAFFYDFQSEEFFNDVLENVKVPTKIKLNQEDQIVIDRYNGKINPIIVNFLKMASFDFKDTDLDQKSEGGIDDVNQQISVNILGHIFEQSIGDLEELHNTAKTQRKKEGVFYTPEYVTRYICNNTIIPYLSKNGATEPSDLVIEYKEDIEKLEEELNEIEILDPACGSGAFLVKAVDVLISIYDEIQNFKQLRGSYTVTKRGKKESGTSKIMTFDKETDQEKARGFIQNNIYGVDLNPESVEITKLSLFLKIATKNKRLIGLSQRIKVGNSIIDDGTLNEKAFQWNTEFAKILDPKYGEKFDLIIGNPPYIPIELLSDSEKKYYSKTYDGLFRKYDTSIIFVEKSSNLLKNGGYLAFIMPLTWQDGDNYSKFRKLIFKEKNLYLNTLINLPFDVFKDAYVDTGIAIFKNNRQDFFSAYEYNKTEKISKIENSLTKRILFKNILDNPEFEVHASKKPYEITNLKNNEERLGSITSSTQGGVTSKLPIENTKKSNNFIPFLINSDANRYKFQIRETAFIDKTSISSTLDLYTQPKILIRRTVNRQNRIMAFYDDSSIVTNKDYNPFVILEPKKYDIFYLLGLLNSKLISYWYVSTSTIALKDDNRQTTLSKLRRLRIKSQDINGEIKKIANLSKTLSNLLNNYFNKKDDVFEMISDNFSIKINKKLQNITSLDFFTFRREIEKISKKEMSLDIQQEWKKYFNSIHSDLVLLKNEIISMDNQIDSLVYSLYDIDETTQKLIDEKILPQPL